MRIALIRIPLLLLLFAAANFGIAGETGSADIVMFAQVDNLRVRERPGLKSRVIDYLSRGESIAFGGICSRERAKIKLRGRMHHEPWCKIKTRYGTSGWVYLGGLSTLPARPRVRIVLPGSWHGDELRELSGQSFFAVTRRPGRFRPRPVYMRIKRVSDPVVDGDTGEKTGKLVQLNRSVANLSFLVKGVNMERGHRIRTLALPGGELIMDRPLTFDGPDEGRVTLRFEKQASDSRAARIALEMNGRRQILRTYTSTDDKTPRVIWAGDLDGDNRLDLLMDMSNHYNVSEYTLFLSSRRGKKRFVGKAAVFRTTGC